MKTSTRSLASVLALSLALAACGGSGTTEESSGSDEAAREVAAARAELAAAEAEIADLEDELDALGEPEALAMVETAGEETEAGGHTEPGSHGNWSYSGVTGPDNWASLNSNFAVCESGVNQSPIDLPSTGLFPVGLDDLQIDWPASSLIVVNNGHTIQANVPPGSTTVIDGITYNLLQFHFHKPSEHTVGGEAFPMELHFVHADVAGNLAVLGVLLAQGGQANPAFTQLWNSQPPQTLGETVIDGFDATTLLPAELTRWRYNGSLTTPPCSEGVNWNVLATPTRMSANQIAAFLFDGNARPTLDLEGRAVLADQS